MELKIENVSKSYGKTKALTDFSAVMTTGVYGLIGPNGSGKSTLMQIITKNIAPDAGSVYWNGASTDRSAAEFLSLVGYMPQEAGLYPQLSVTEFLFYMAAVKGVDRAAAKKQIPDILEAVSLSEASYKRISELSGGMKQRTCFAQALLGSPRVLLLDEPTAGLDPSQRVAVRSMLARLSSDRLILISTHVIGDVEGIAKELLLLSKGRLIDQISPAGLVKKMEGRVFVVPFSESVSEKSSVISVSLSDGEMKLRIISDDPPSGAVPVPPTLEDAYLSIYGTGALSDTRADRNL